ncbi:MAG: GGDEF domain-containing protein [Clostridiales bacterium]|nr:GGDEF domain-containing protein [Clostridiales bacterium]
MKKVGFGPFKIASIYFILGLVWIYFSDKILYFFTKNQIEFLNYSILKGTVFIIVSSVVIYFLVKKEIEKRIKIWEYYATHDSMTGCLNRRAGLEKLEDMIDRNQHQVTIVYADLNNLKYINDNFGHIMGDNAIIKTAKIFKNNIRKNDFVIRLGGDEFLIVLNQCSENMAQNIIERINNNIKQANDKQDSVRLSVSFGVVAYSEKYSTVNDFISEADRRMYENKKVFHSQLKFA